MGPAFCFEALLRPLKTPLLGSLPGLAAEPVGGGSWSCILQETGPRSFCRVCRNNPGTKSFSQSSAGSSLPPSPVGLSGWCMAGRLACRARGAVRVVCCSEIKRLSWRLRAGPSPVLRQTPPRARAAQVSLAEQAACSWPWSGAGSTDAGGEKSSGQSCCSGAPSLKGVWPGSGPG